MTSRSADFLERTVGLFRSVWQRAGRRDDSADALLADIDPDLPDDQIEVVRRQIDDAPDGVGSAWREDRWLGAPIDDVDESLLGELADAPDLLGKETDLELPEVLLEDDEDIDLL